MLVTMRVMSFVNFEFNGWVKVQNLQLDKLS